MFLGTIIGMGDLRPGGRRHRPAAPPGPRPDELGLDDAPGHRRRGDRAAGSAGRSGLDPSSGLTSWVAAIGGAVLLLVALPPR